MGDVNKYIQDFTGGLSDANGTPIPMISPHQQDAATNEKNRMNVAIKTSRYLQKKQDEAPSPNIPDVQPIRDNFISSIFKPITSIMGQGADAVQDISKGKIEGALKGGLTAVNTAFLPATIPLSGISGAAQDVGATDVAEGINRTMQIPFNLLKSGSEAYDQILNHLGIPTHLKNQELDKVANELLITGGGLGLLGNLHGVGKEITNNNTPLPNIQEGNAGIGSDIIDSHLGDVIPQTPNKTPIVPTEGKYPLSKVQEARNKLSNTPVTDLLKDEKTQIQDRLNEIDNQINNPELVNGGKNVTVDMFSLNREKQQLQTRLQALGGKNAISEQKSDESSIRGIPRTGNEVQSENMGKGNPESEITPNAQEKGSNKPDAEQVKSENILDAPVFRKALQKEFDQAKGQEILDKLDEQKITPQSVAEKFWKETYPKLDARTKAKFDKMIPPEARGEGADYGLRAGDLEGTERGDIALMHTANEMYGKSSTPPEKAGEKPITESPDLGEKKGLSSGDKFMDDKGRTGTITDMNVEGRPNVAKVKLSDGKDTFISKKKLQSNETEFPFGENVKPKEQNFTEFANENKYPSDYDVLEHGTLGESGHTTKRAKNTLFTEDEASKRALRLSDKYSKGLAEGGNFKVDKQDLEDLMYIGGHFVEKGIRDFADWSKEMIKELPERLKNVVDLKDLYNKVKADNPEFFSEEKPVLGISQKVKEQREETIGTKAPESGEGWSPQEAVDRGKDLIKQGVKPEDELAKFQKDGRTNADMVATVRTKLTDLQKESGKTYDTHGKDSPEFKEAQLKEEKWAKDIQPILTEWSKMGAGMMGAEEIDTGSVYGMERSFKDRTGKDFTPEQSKVAEQLTTRIKELSDKVDEKNKQISDLISRNEKLEKSPRSIRTQSKDVADKIRTAKIHRPGVFSAATPASLAWDAGVETVAQVIEKGGVVADAIQKGIEKIKETDWYKGLNSKKQQEAETEFKNWHNDQLKTKVDISKDFADKKGNKFSTQEVNAIWKHAKDNYIDKGVTDFNDMVDGVSKDTGLSNKQVRSAIAQPKQIREITDERYRLQNARNKAIQNAKAWVRSADTPQAVKFLKAIPSVFFGAKVFGHGTVGMITHAGMDIYRPSSWRIYFPNFIKQFKLAFDDTAGYEKEMSDLKHGPDFIFWKRNKLAVDPDKIYNEYEQAGKFFGRLGEMGNRGFQILKIHRLEVAKDIYKHLSDVEKSDPDTAKEIAQWVNHSTGTTDVNLPKVANTLFFAPKLEVSRWQRLTTDPAKAVGTFLNWKDAKPSDKVFAKLWAKKSAETLGTLAGLLAANQALLSLSGSTQRINFTDPTKGDFLKFKAGNKVIDASGGMLSTVSFVGQMMGAWIESQKQLHGDTRSQAMFKAIGNYGRGKLSPFAGTSFDVASHTDYAGNVLPFYSDKPQKGRVKYGVGEYFLRQQTPIPISEGINDVYEQMKLKGMSEPQIKDILTGIFLSVSSGGTGARVRQDFNVKKTEY